MDFRQIRMLTFYVVGTLIDFEQGIINHFRDIGSTHDLHFKTLVELADHIDRHLG